MRLGQLRQRHEADWEAVTIGFADRAPLFVGFSEHCGDQWYEWDDVRMRAAGSRLRPLVATKKLEPDAAGPATPTLQSLWRVLVAAPSASA